MEKRCTNCCEVKYLLEFQKDNQKKDGYKSYCKLCVKKYYKGYDKNYYENNKEHKNQNTINYRKNNPDKNKETQKKYYQNNRERIIENAKNWQEANPDKTKEMKLKASKKQRENNPHIIAWRGILRSTLKRMSKKKEDKTINLLGYSPLELKQHIEALFTEGMSWDNHGEWHIDHIIEVCTFKKETPPSIVNALSNLRPLWATTREINGIVYEGNLNRFKFLFL
jgi:hypothetical protein